MADAEDLKSSGDFSSCGFDSHPGYQFVHPTRFDSHKDRDAIDRDFGPQDLTYQQVEQSPQPGLPAANGTLDEPLFLSKRTTLGLQLIFRFDNGPI
jgi:hypothetical protein